MKINPIELSLTDFVDFTTRVSQRKISKIKELKSRGDYETYKDFYKRFREGVIKTHKNSHGKPYLDEILSLTTDEKKIKAFTDLVRGYKKFWGKKEIKWFTPPHKKWSHGNLEIRINPELGLEINGVKYLIKLYFKDEALKKADTKHILAFLQHELKDIAPKDVVMAILDVRKSNLISESTYNLDLIQLFTTEAEALSSLWERL